MIKSLIAVLTVAVTASASGQSTALQATPENLAIGAYYQCVHDYAASLASTKESPEDIAQAALSRCHKEREGIRAAINSSPMGQNLSPAEVDSTLGTIEENALKFAKDTILQTRYPTKIPPRGV